MITFTKGNLLDAPADALVNCVNTVGVMGKGIALEFRARYPENYRQYRAACSAGEVHVGKMFVTRLWEPDRGRWRWVVNFPTKQHWRAPSKMEWISAGLQDLRRFLVESPIQSIALPRLGAGNGGLDWVQVREQILVALQDLEDINILVFEVPND